MDALWGPLGGVVGGIFGRELIRLIFRDREQVRAIDGARVHELERQVAELYARLLVQEQMIGALKAQNAELATQVQYLQQGKARIRIVKESHE